MSQANGQPNVLPDSTNRSNEAALLVDQKKPQFAYGCQFTLADDDHWHLLNEPGLILQSPPVIAGSDREIVEIKIRNVGPNPVQVGGEENADQSLSLYPIDGDILPVNDIVVLRMPRLGCIAMRNTSGGAGPSTISILLVATDK